jgi:hypothetical protein
MIAGAAAAGLRPGVGSQAVRRGPAGLPAPHPLGHDRDRAHDPGSGTDNGSDDLDERHSGTLLGPDGKLPSGEWGPRTPRAEPGGRADPQQPSLDAITPPPLRRGGGAGSVPPPYRQGDSARTIALSRRWCSTDARVSMSCAPQPHRCRPPDSAGDRPARAGPAGLLVILRGSGRPRVSRLARLRTRPEYLAEPPAHRQPETTRRAWTRTRRKWPCPRTKPARSSTRSGHWPGS